MSIAKIMTTELITVSPDKKVGELYKTLQSLPIHHLLVVDNEKLVGIISDRDILKNISPYANTTAEEAKDRFTIDREAHKVMCSKVITCSPSASIRDAASMLLEHNISLLPVTTKDNTLVGVLSWKDILRYLTN